MNCTNKRGVDISSNNGNVDMQKIKNAGFDFVMIRLGYGSNLQSQDDSWFEENVRKCEKIGMPWGAYLYSYALNTDDAKSEAEHTLRLLKGKKPELPVAFDMEDADGYKNKNGAMRKSLITEICKTYLSEIARAGYYPMLYTGLYFMRDYIGSEVTDKYDIWLAQWYTRCEYTGSNLGMWQYGGEVNYIEDNSISGVGIIDKDKCFKDYPTIIRNGGYNNWKKGENDMIIQEGDSGAAVYLLKQNIIAFKKLGLITQGVDDNDKYGEGTKLAVKQIQEAYNKQYPKSKITVDGIAGEQTIKAIRLLLENISDTTKVKALETKIANAVKALS